MAKFADTTGLGRLLSKLKNYIDTLINGKQDTLVSGTNIKTVNGKSLLGAGGVDTEFIVHYVNGTFTEPFADVKNAIDNGVSIIFYNEPEGNYHPVIEASSTNSDCYLYYQVYETSNSDICFIRWVYGSNGVVDRYYYYTLPNQATSSEYGLVKLNPEESVTLNSDGQLDVGGRLGAFPGTTGIFHAKDRAPRNVGDYSFLITDAKGINLSAPRDFALVTGVNLTLTKSHAAGSTTYTVNNTYANRIACAVLANGGYVSQSEAYSKENQIVPVTSVKINGSNYTPNSDPNDSSSPIIITTETTANPTSAVTQLRIFGGITGGYCSEYIGQCVGGTLGASLAIGQRVYSSSNVNCIVAADVYNTGNGNAIFGRQHISRKNRSLLAGTGHDTTNARSESASAVGEWSDITSETLFAVGDGTSHVDRSNAFEVRDQAFVVKSPNGTKWKVTIDNTGNLVTTAVSS